MSDAPVWKTLILNQGTNIEILCSKLINSYVTMLFLCQISPPRPVENPNAGTSESNKGLFSTLDKYTVVAGYYLREILTKIKVK